MTNAPENPVRQPNRIRRITFWIFGWLLTLFLSIAITLPFVAVAIELAPVPPPPPAGIKDLGYGFVAFPIVAMTAVGSFIIIWPLAVWLTRKLLNKYLLKKVPQIPLEKNHG
jgi:hypothetical protein